MNVTALLTLIFLVSCGEQLLPEEPGQGLRRTEELSVDDKLVSSELNTLRQVCGHLKSKDNFFQGNIINTSAQFEFSTESKNCEDEERISSDVTLEVQQTGTLVTFINLSQEGEFFSDYEGFEQGLIAPFCDKISQTISTIPRFIKSGNRISWVYPLGKNPTYCPDGDDTLCVVIELGEVTSEYSATVDERHSIAISNRNTSRRGMVITRMLESTSNCSEGYRYLFSNLLRNQLSNSSEL